MSYRFDEPVAASAESSPDFFAGTHELTVFGAEGWISTDPTESDQMTNWSVESHDSRVQVDDATHLPFVHLTGLFVVGVDSADGLRRLDLFLRQHLRVPDDQGVVVLPRRRTLDIDVQSIQDLASRGVALREATREDLNAALIEVADEIHNQGQEALADIDAFMDDPNAS